MSKLQYTFSCMEYNSFFQPLEVTRHTLLLWLSLFKAETEPRLPPSTTN